MGPPPRGGSQTGKQSTLSSFFAPKAAESAVEAGKRKQGTSSEVPIDLDDSDEDGARPDRKRAKAAPTASSSSAASPALLSGADALLDDDELPELEAGSHVNGANRKQSTSAFFKAAPKAVKSSESAKQRLAAFARSSQSTSAGGDDKAKAMRHEAFRKKLLVRNAGRGPVVYAQKEGVWAPGAEEAMLKGGTEARPAYLSAAEGEADDAVEDAVLEEDDSPAPAKHKSAANLDRFASTTSRGKGKGKAKVDAGPKYTPLEQQWLAIKKDHPDVVLLMEVGYKFVLRGEDARIASLHLSIAHFPSHNFATAMVPAHRVHIHVRRLVMAGFKVGVVRQIETRALKKGGATGDKSGPFKRELKEVWTRSTWVDGMDAASKAGAQDPEEAIQQAWIVALRATPGGGSGSAEKVSMALVGVCPQNGQVVWDEWDDGHLRAGLETRWLHLSGTATRGPGEVVRVGDWDATTSRVVDWLAGVGGERGGVRQTRIEAAKAKVDAKADFTFVTDFCRPRPAGKTDAMDVEDEAEHEAESEWLKAVVDLPPKVISALAALIRHMDTYSLASVLRRPSRFSHLSSRRHMLLPGTTVTNLELYANATDGRTRGSLLWILDRTKTVMGRRLLRDWIGRPLVDIAELRLRQSTVAELASSTSWQAGKLKNLVMGLPDLEKGLVRIHYGKCTPAELVRILDALHRVSSEYEAFGSPEDVGFESAQLNEIVFALPLIRPTVERYLALVDPSAAREGRKEDMFRDEEENVPDIVDCKDCVAAVDVEIGVHLRECRKLLGKPALNFITVAQEELLLEIPIAQSKKVPADWLKINGTKSVYRYRTPRAQELLEQRDQGKERLAATAEEAFSAFLENMTADYEPLRDVVRKLAVVDCLLSLASVAHHPGYCRPEFVERPHVELKRARHPVVEQVTEDPYVDNDLLMEETGTSTLIFTGNNMGGKSSASRMIACIVIMAQIGSFVPAASAKLGIFDSCYTRMGASDELARGRSTFMVEMSEASDILKMATPRSLVILDELGRGTSTHDGVAIASAVLHHLVASIGCFTIFVTHYPQISQIAKAHPEAVKSFHMSFLETHRDDGFQDVTFLYKIAPGAATRSHGLNVARMAGLPGGILTVAKRQAESLEEEMEVRRREQSAAKAARLLRGLQGGHAESRELVELAKGISYASQ